MERNEKKLTTNEIIEKLGVSRQWINTYLRDMGEIDTIKNGPKRPKRVVLYPEKKLIEWLNDHAACTCQIGWIDLCKFIPLAKIKAKEKEIKKIVERLEAESFRENDRQKAIEAKLIAINMWDNFLRAKLPAEIYDSHIKSAAIRDRGKIEHVLIDYRIENLDDLLDMKALKLKYEVNSNELVYRGLFSKGAIKVQICGRIWYAEPKKDYEHPIKVEYAMKKMIESNSNRLM